MKITTPAAFAAVMLICVPPLKAEIECSTPPHVAAHPADIAGDGALRIDDRLIEERRRRRAADLARARAQLERSRSAERAAVPPATHDAK